jgi:hypothetical protein
MDEALRVNVTRDPESMTAAFSTSTVVASFRPC